MQDELRRSNSIGNVEGVDTFLSLIFAQRLSSVKALNYACRFLLFYQLNCRLALLLLEDFNFFKFYKTTHFITAFSRLYFKSEYEHDKMKTKLITHRTSLEKRSTSDEYLVLLCNRI